MSRIEKQFAEIRRRGSGGFVPFITVGDPDISTTVELAAKLAELGADAIELGVPFSDPMADGPTIQASSMRALAAGTKLSHVFEAVAEIRKQTDAPLVLFSYLNPLLKKGLEKVRRSMADSGVDGLLVLDVVDDEAEAIRRLICDSGIDLIPLVAPTTSDERLQWITEKASGFIYAVSRTGVTGIRTGGGSDARMLVSRIRSFTDLPVAVGFGISEAAHIEDVWEYADAAVVGSAIVKVVAESPGEEVAAVERAVRRLLPRFANAEGQNYS